jgi:hypothetical protein
MSVTKPSDLIGRAPGGRKLIAVVYADMVDYSRLTPFMLATTSIDFSTI